MKVSNYYWISYGYNFVFIVSYLMKVEMRNLTKVGTDNICLKLVEFMFINICRMLRFERRYVWYFILLVYCMAVLFRCNYGS